jgi:hypothetical protein
MLPSLAPYNLIVGERHGELTENACEQELVLGFRRWTLFTEQ